MAQGNHERAGIKKSNTELCKRNGGVGRRYIFYNLGVGVLHTLPVEAVRYRVAELEAAFGSENRRGEPVACQHRSDKLKITQKRSKTWTTWMWRWSITFQKYLSAEIHGLPSHYSHGYLLPRVSRQGDGFGNQTGAPRRDPPSGTSMQITSSMYSSKR